MSLTAPERRKIAVLSGDRRLDLALPLDDTLGDALREVGLTMEPGRHVLLERNGSEAQLSARGEDLLDGTLFAVVDLRATPTEGPEVRRAAHERAERGMLWWLLGTVAVISVAVSLSDGVLLGGALERLAASGILGLGSVVAALMWALRRPKDAVAESLAMLAPLALAFAAGAVAIPASLESSTHLSVVAGLLAASVLGAVLTLTVGGMRLRSAAGTATIILLIVSAIWGLTLLATWGVPAAAAISVGIVPLGLRALPSTLINVHEGYHIDYKHFMSSRWTVRGAIPDSPGSVTMAEVRDVVNDSTARLATGTVFFSLLGALMLPVALTGSTDTNGFVIGGTIGLLCTVAIALLLIPRHTATPILRWVPRAACAVVVVTATMLASAVLGPLWAVLSAGGLLALGVLAAAVLVPIGRGARSLAWSRLADVFEALAVALSLPAALLAADALNLLRGMMSA